MRATKVLSARKTKLFSFGSAIIVARNLNEKNISKLALARLPVNIDMDRLRLDVLK